MEICIQVKIKSQKKKNVFERKREKIRLRNGGSVWWTKKRKMKKVKKNFDEMREIVRCVSEGSWNRDYHFTITTNGTLLNEKYTS